ncbi:hypothetical protein OnM2_000032 [Erysiphe neolycopersici]|uniref:Uncharacterized protein n=1 Tax=Erysiphe neolycopersici TaxID=212602 RepID=A0A420I8M3_9PEZI|nr:hypothetical protein OnM2_000032 [Erysiphe neolycopersici]
MPESTVFSKGESEFTAMPVITCTGSSHQYDLLNRCFAFP